MTTNTQQQTSPQSIEESKPLSPVDEFKTAWNEFNRALRDIKCDFDQWYWLRALFISGIRCLLHISNLLPLIESIRSNIGHILQNVPLIAISLVFSITICYLVSLRDVLIVQRGWCSPVSDEEGVGSCPSKYGNGDCNVSDCKWYTFHTWVPIYLSFMIIFNYTLTVFTSPGIVLPPQEEEQQGENITQSEEKPTNQDQNRKSKKKVVPFASKSIHRRGGCFYLSPKFNEEDERKRVALYYGTNGDGKNDEEDWSSTKNTVYSPSPLSSYCKKCKMWRPPRSHHCSTSDRCVLQMDHHCMWMNNCIGYNNYRSFFLTLVYLVAGCWYGIFLFAMPFYELIEEQIKEHGFRLFYENNTGFLDLPMPQEMIIGIWNTGSLDPDVSVKLIFPLLLTVGVILTNFLSSHIRYVCKALTTLEYMATLQILKADALGHLRRRNSPDTDQVKDDGNALTLVNPFDQGVAMNIRQILGSNLLYVFLPIYVMAAPPYIPKLKEKETWYLWQWFVNAGTYASANPLSRGKAIVKTRREEEMCTLKSIVMSEN